MTEDIRDFEEDEMDADGRALEEDGPGDEPKRRVRPIVRTANVLAAVVGLDWVTRDDLRDAFDPDAPHDPEAVIRRNEEAIVAAEATIAQARETIARFRKVAKLAERIESLDETGRKVVLAVLRAEVRT